jgi:hypothetical protein
MFSCWRPTAYQYFIGTFASVENDRVNECMHEWLISPSLSELAKASSDVDVLVHHAISSNMAFILHRREAERM